jgi:hypothetical protein
VHLRSRWLRRAGRAIALVVLLLVLGPALYVALAGDARPGLTLPAVPGPGPYRVYVARVRARGKAAAVIHVTLERRCNKLPPGASRYGSARTHNVTLLHLCLRRAVLPPARRFFP